MIFDKNAKMFPSDFHREVWWWAIGIVPLPNSLTDEVKSKCGPEVLEGCRQWHAYFNELCEDMYGNADAYLPASARQYRDILEMISGGGELRDDDMIWKADEWEKRQERLNKSKAYRTGGITVHQCLRALERTGLRCESSAGGVAFRQDMYPKVFHAMHTMEHSPDMRNTPGRHHFAHCEFRQLFKSYSANYDELLRRASDDSLHIAHSIHDHCKSLKIQRNIHFGIIKYKYKGIRVLDFNLHGNEYPTLRINMGTCARPDVDINDDDYYRVLLSQNRKIQETFMKNLIRCDDQDHERHSIMVAGREELICPCSRLRINPLAGDLEALLIFISARKASIDQYC